MTQRKPPGVPFEGFADAQIRKAREEGQFDDLPGKGKPLDTQDVYDPLWWGKQLVRREGISVLPPALEIRRTVERELERIDQLKSENQVRGTIAALNDKIRLVNRSNVSGPPTTQAILDVEKVVSGWREARKPSPKQGA